MLPRRVGGAELSLRLRLLLLRLAEAHDQLPRSGPLPLPWLLPPLANGGKVGGGVSGREWGCEADWSEYAEKDSRIRWSSGGTALLGEGG